MIGPLPRMTIQQSLARISSLPARLAPRLTACQTSHASVLALSILQNPSEHFFFAHVRMAEPNIHKCLAPSRNRHCSHASALAKQIDNNAVALPQSQLIQSQTHSFRPSNSTSEQQPDDY